jgi:SAM-dependent methyltransferase
MNGVHGLTAEGPDMNTPEDPTLFTSVDHTADPTFFIRFMEEGHRLPDIISSRGIVMDTLHLVPGKRILDVGCGPALDALDLAARVASDGELVGVDLSEAMINAARKRIVGSTASTRFEVAAAEALPFDDSTFDACRAERLFMHLTEPQRVLDEMSRVTRPGGRICVVDFDWQTFVLYHPADEPTDLIISGLIDDMANGRIGRQLPRMFAATGLSDIGVHLHPVRLSLRFNELFLGGYLTRLQREGRLAPERAQLGLSRS